MFDLYTLFESVDLIVDKRVQAAQSQMDRTFLCTITNADKAEYGEYTVTGQGSSFVAHCDDTTYKTNDLVYVGVPASDFSNAFIIAKKITEIASQGDLSAPFRNYYKMLTKQDAQEHELQLSTVPVELLSMDIDNSAGYNALGIETVFQSHFLKQPKESSYGLLISVQTNQNTSGEGEPVLRAHPFTLNSTNMAGNVFNFIGDSIQRILIDLKGLSNIVKIKVYGFFDWQEDAPLTDVINNYIKVKSLEISLGHHLEDDDKSDLYIYTNDSTTYNNADAKGADLTKTVYARWMYIDNDAMKVVTNENRQDMPKNASLIWQKLVNNNWVAIDDSINQFKFNPSAFDKFSTNEVYRAVVQYQSFDAEAPIEYVSNSLTFTNANSNFANIVIDKSVTVEAEIDDYSTYYGPDGKILDPGLARQPRVVNISAKMQDVVLDSNMLIQVRWKFPKTNSMIIPLGFKNEAGVIQELGPTSVDSEYNIYTQTLLQGASTPKNNLLTGSIYYKINNLYSPKYKNNTITCELIVSRVQENGGEQLLQLDTATSTLKFIRNGICKNDKILQLILRDEKGREVSCIAPGQTVTVEAHLYDCNGTELALARDIDWSWWSAPDEKEYTLNPGVENSDITIPQFLSCKSLAVNACSIIAQYDKYIYDTETKQYYYSNTIKSPETDEVQYEYSATNITYAEDQVTITDISMKDLGYVLKAEYIEKVNDTDEEDGAKVIAYLPIGINFYSELASYLSGPTSVYYNSAGGEPSYYNGVYSVYTVQDNIIDGTQWYGLLKGTSQADMTMSLYPSIGKLNNQYYLCPKLTYTRNADKHYTVIGTYNGVLMWVQSVLIAQTDSFSSFVNDWDGSFKLDEASNTAMMARLGAGQILPNNKFSGVLLGDWSEQVEDKSITRTGIYGFDANIQSFGLRDDGTSYFGKAGAGRIAFNGDLGTVYSGNFNGKPLIVSSENLLPKNYSELILDHNFPVKGSGDWASDTTLNNSPDNYFKLTIDNTENYLKNLIIKNILISTTNSVPSDRTGEAEVYANIDYAFSDAYTVPELYMLSCKVKINKLAYVGIASDGDGYAYTYIADNIDTTRTGAIYTNYCENENLVFNSRKEKEETNKQLYNNGLYEIKMIVPRNNATATSLKVPLLSFLGQNLKSDVDPSIRLINLEIIDLCLNKVLKHGFIYKEGVLQEDLYNIATVLDEGILSNSEILCDLIDTGSQGTFLDLKEGKFYTNQGHFRGILEAEDLIVEKDITIGNEETGEYITIGPSGVSLTPTVIVNSGGVINGSGGCDCDFNNMTVTGTFTVDGTLTAGEKLGFSDGFISRLKDELELSEDSDDSSELDELTINQLLTIGGEIELATNGDFGQNFTNKIKALISDIQNTDKVSRLTFIDPNDNNKEMLSLTGVSAKGSDDSGIFVEGQQHLNFYVLGQNTDRPQVRAFEICSIYDEELWWDIPYMRLYYGNSTYASAHARYMSAYSDYGYAFSNGIVLECPESYKLNSSPIVMNAEIYPGYGSGESYFLLNAAGYNSLDDANPYYSGAKGKQHYGIITEREAFTTDTDNNCFVGKYITLTNGSSTFTFQIAALADSPPQNS